jgi:hypothetical protein
MIRLGRSWTSSSRGLDRAEEAASWGARTSTQRTPETSIFSDDGGASQLGAVTGDVGSGLAVSLVVGVDTTTQPGSSGRGPRG